MLPHSDRRAALNATFGRYDRDQESCLGFESASEGRLQPETDCAPNFLKVRQAKRLSTTLPTRLQAQPVTAIPVANARQLHRQRTAV